MMFTKPTKLEMLDTDVLSQAIAVVCTVARCTLGRRGAPSDDRDQLPEVEDSPPISFEDRNSDEL